jgi:hypothetical protein
VHKYEVQLRDYVSSFEGSQILTSGKPACRRLPQFEAADRDLEALSDRTKVCANPPFQILNCDQKDGV